MKLFKNGFELGSRSSLEDKIESDDIIHRRNFNLDSDVEIKGIRQGLYANNTTNDGENHSDKIADILSALSNVVDVANPTGYTELIGNAEPSEILEKLELSDARIIIKRKNEGIINEINQLIEQPSIKQISLDGKLASIYDILLNFRSYLVKFNSLIDDVFNLDDNPSFMLERREVYKKLVEQDSKLFNAIKKAFMTELQKKIDKKEATTKLADARIIIKRKNEGIINEINQLIEQPSIKQISLDGKLASIYDNLLRFRSYLVKFDSLTDDVFNLDDNPSFILEHSEVYKKWVEQDSKLFNAVKKAFMIELQKKIDKKEATTKIQNSNLQSESTVSQSEELLQQDDVKQFTESKENKSVSIQNDNTVENEILESRDKVHSILEKEQSQNEDLQSNNTSALKNESTVFQSGELIEHDNVSKTTEDKETDSIFSNKIDMIQSFDFYEKGDITLVEYILKDGQHEFSIVEDKQKIAQEVRKYMSDPDLPNFSLNSIYGVEQFLRSITKHLQLYYKVKEYIVFKNISREDLPNVQEVESELNFFRDVKKLLEDNVKRELEFASDLAPLWWRGECDKYPNLHYSGGNPFNLHGVDGKYNYLLKPEQDNIIYERGLMLELASMTRGPISSQEVFYSIYGIYMPEKLIQEKNDLHNLEGKSF